MASTVEANASGAIHQGSGHTHVVFPDVCKTPPWSIPVPYPNVARSSDAVDGPKTVELDGCMPVVKDTVYQRSSGDEAGSDGGVVGGTNRAEAAFMMYSFDVKIEGRNVCRVGDPMFHNHKNAVG